MRRTKIALALAATIAAAGTLPQAASAQTLQWQTANLTESQFEPVWKQIIAEFEAANPGVKIEPVLVARRDHWTKFVTAAQARQAPCIVSVDLTTAAYNGYLRPLDDVWSKEPTAFQKAWSDDMLASAKWKGKLYGLPIWGGIYAEVYNRDMVVKAGLDPAKPPKTWDDYLAWSKKLTGNDQWALAVLGGPTDTTTRVLLTWIYSNGGEPFNADMTESRFAKDKKSLDAIKFYLGLASKEGVASPAPTTTNYLEQTNLFAQGKIASMRNAYWAMAKVVGDNPAMNGKMFVADPPRMTEKVVTLSTVTPSSISASCQYPDIAWKFIKFEAEAKWAIARAKVANWMPLRTDILDNPEIKSDPTLLQFLEIGRYAKSYPLPHPHWADIAAKDIVEAVQKALLQPDRLEAIFTELDTKLTKKLNDL